MDFQLSQAIEILSQTPQTVKSLLGNLSEEWVFNSESEEGWSAFDVIGHYIHGEETDWIPRAEIILAQGENLRFEPFDRFAQLEKSEGKTFSELLETFAELRRKNIEILESWKLTEDQLNLKGIHPELGEVTLEQLLATWVVHDLTHIRQIVSVMAKQYAENVGEWRAYLSILQS
ncbi:MAG TPA: DinB family protein [Pyrinomonadaceae bacterium]|jgi:predicted CopG family antitoxin